jgi:hypothetical protein
MRKLSNSECIQVRERLYVASTNILLVD